jgi:hypothetical protein
MGNVIMFEGLLLDDKSVDKIKAMNEECNEQEGFELKKVSGLEFASCPYCKNNGCYGACSIGR